MDPSDQISSGLGAPAGQITSGASAAAALPGLPADRPDEAPGLNEKIIFVACIMTLISAGIGFAVRADILGNWARQFHFTQTELGGIVGGGLTGFGISIIILSFFADHIGYARLMILAFLLHATSGIVTLLAPLAYDHWGSPGAYWCLNIGMWLFALGNGTCEAVINPLTAALFRRQKTHFLNILHAGWPLGLILGGLIGLGFNQFAKDIPGERIWLYKFAVFLVPTLLYGLLMVGRKFPRSETSASGIKIGTMIMTLLSPILLFLFIIHAMIGFVELGTDSWIIDITKLVLGSADIALWAFIWTNAMMFALRFFAGPLVHKISPIGLLLASAIIGTAGLLLLGRPEVNVVWLWVGAVTIYGIGKTFYWPTMLGVISERYPKAGALALGISGGIGMISAGMLGGPGIGYFQDLNAVRQLESGHKDTYDRYKAQVEKKGEDGKVVLDADGKPEMVDNPKGFLTWTGQFPTVTGLDGAKVGVLLGDPGQDNGMGKKLKEEIDNVTSDGSKLEDHKELNSLNAWWLKEGKDNADKDKAPLEAARLHGGKTALTWTAVVPATMALCFLALLLLFRAQGGYQAQVLTGHAAEDKKFTGGVAGPVE